MARGWLALERKLDLVLKLYLLFRLRGELVEAELAKTADQHFLLTWLGKASLIWLIAAVDADEIHVHSLSRMQLFPAISADCLMLEGDERCVSACGAGHNSLLDCGFEKSLDMTRKKNK